jgi:peptidoglycan/LPS O-acetylase OafA/YrhL
MKERLPVLDGLRGLAILLVMVCHTAAVLHWPGPYPVQLVEQLANSGVDLFFVLSGFLLFYPYAQSIVLGAPWPSWRTFYLRRARRILPAFYVVSALMFVFVVLVAPATVPLSQTMHPLVREVPAFVTLLYDMRPDTYAFAVTINGVLWTLTIEWQFYLVLPWLALLLKRWSGGRPQKLLIGLGGVLLWGIGVRALAAIGHYHLGWSDPILPLIYGQNGKRLELFALGMIVAVLFSTRQTLSRGVASTITAVSCLGFGVCVVWANGQVGLSWTPNWSWGIFGSAVMSTCYAGILWVGLTGFDRALVLRPLRGLGKISYSVYLIHWPIVFVIGILGLWAVLLVWGIVLLLSMACYRYVEAPFLKTRPWHQRPATQAVAQPAP